MTNPIRIRRWSIVAMVAICAWSAAACDESLNGLQPAGPVGGAEAVVVVPVTSQDLLAQFGVQLLTPIRVRVVDSAGHPLRSATVRYSVLAGAGLFSADSTLTNDEGFTEVQFLPTATGTVIVEARVDRSGGTDRARFTIQVLSNPDEVASFDRLGGDGQSGQVGSVLPSALVVKVTNPDGFPVDSFPVTFTLRESHGTLAGVADTPDGPFAGQVTVTTDASGTARAFLRLGTEAGSHVVEATAVVGPSGEGATESVFFTETATASTRAAQLIVVSGGTQTTVVDTIHERDSDEYRGREPNPLVVQALDAFGNPVQGVPISWFVEDGGGTIALFSTTTDQNGVSINVLSGVTVGRNAVVAFAPGADPVTFTITGENYEPPAEAPAGGGGGGGG